MEQFHILDSNHPKGRVSVQTYVISYGDPNIITSYLKWFGLPNLSHEWIQPGETTTLTMRLRAVGKAGTIDIPVQYTVIDELNNKIVKQSATQGNDCYDTDTVELTIDEGELQGPLLVQKTLLANDLYECIRLGEEVSALWQVMNTSAVPRYIRFREVIPGYLPSSVSIPVLLSANTASAESGMSFIDEAYGFQADGEVATLQSELILLPPNTTLYFTDIYDVSAYASPSGLSSTFYVWETDENGVPEAQPGNAISFTNTPIQVCAPLVTKTAVGDYCDVEGEATITYQVDVDRIIWGSIFAYTIFEDQYPSGTSYLPIAVANGAVQLYEYTTRPGSTLWALGEYDQYVQIPPVVNGNNPLFSDKLQLSYLLKADNIDGSELVNTFTIRNGSVYNLDIIPIGKRAVLGEASRTPRRAGDFLRAPQQETAKLANGNYPDITSYYDATLVTESASHSLLAECITVTYTIDGYKFDDLNGNGVRDSGEPGVESWMIVAQSSAGTFTAVTDANGYYRIEGLPGAVWQVRESYQLGWVQSAPGGEGFYNVQLGEQVQTASLDFGNWRPSRIYGTKYTDTDGSGRRNKFEPKIEGVHIELRDLSGTVLQQTQTDGGGYYEFEDIAPGHYTVRESGNTDTRQSQPGPQEGGFYYIVATSGSAHPYKDFGNYVPVSISGTVSEAVGKNVDGSTEQHDTTVRDVRQLKVQLQRMGPNASYEPIHKVASDAIVLDLDEKGIFVVDGLQPGDWQVSVVLAEYWNAASENPVDVFIPSGGSATVDFSVLFDRLAAPEVTTSSITGTVFRNTTADHLFNKASDVMVSAHGVRLEGKSERGAGIERTATTGTDGSFRFVDLPAGEYVVSLSGVADTLRQGWPWVEAHRVILGEDQHVGATFAGQESANPPAPVDADLPWKFSTAGAYANLTTRIDDNDDGKADRRNFFSGSAALVRTSAPGALPMTVAHSSLRMAGTDSLGRSILANGLSGGSVGVVSSASRPGATALWIQAIDLVFDLEGTAWYGPTATNASNVPAIVAQLPVSQWLSLYTAAEFAAQAGNAPVIREPFGRQVATVLGASYVFTPGVDFGLTPKRFFPTGSGTGSGSGGIGTNDPGDRADVPLDFTLGSAYPNPFNPSTVIPFELAAAGQVRLAVYDINGRQVAVLVNNTMSAGRHSIAWDASGLPSGVYMVQLSAGGKQFVSKATLLK
jgi:hypothetical protein